MEVPDSELEFDADLVFTHNGVPFTGIAFEETAVGRSEISYRDGAQEGHARDWYPSGGLRGESHYVQNTLHGVTREFDEDGRLVSEFVHEYGLRVSARRFGADGAVIAGDELDPDSKHAELLRQWRAEYGWPQP